MMKACGKPFKVLIIVVLVFTMFCFTPKTEVYAADEYDNLRLKYRDLLTGGASYDLNDEIIIEKINMIEATTEKNWSTMNSNKVWDDLETVSLEKSGALTEMARRLNEMALGYATYGSYYYNNSSLLIDIKAGLDWLYTNRYNENIAQYDNWWPWKIGVPRHLLDTTVILYDQLSSIQRTNYMNAIYHFVPNVTHLAANRADISKVVVLRGILIKDSATVQQGADGLNNVMPYVTSSDGFYTDGSYVDHTSSGGHPYAGSYGAVLLTAVNGLLWLLDGSTWDITSPDRGNVYEWVFDTFEPNLYKGQMLTSTRGRSITRYGPDTYLSWGNFVINSLLLQIEFLSNPYIDSMKGMIKYHLQNSNVNYYYRNLTTISEYLKAKAIMDDINIIPRSELTGYYQFYNQDTAVHRRPGWTFSLRMHSSRVANWETNLNGDNLKGWYTGDGMHYVYQNSLDYLNNYFSTVDPHRMAGTTVDRDTSRPDASRETCCNRSEKDFVGGVNYKGIYGLSSMDFKQHDYVSMDVSARKSWFMFDNEVVALGSGINSTSGRVIETIVENRALGSQGDNAFTVDGVLKPSIAGWSEKMSANWAHLEEMGGYYFPGGATIDGLREERSEEGSYVTSGGYYDGSDSFEGSLLNQSWGWVREDETKWSLSGTEMIIKTQNGTLNNTINSTKNLLLKDVPREDFLATTKLTFSPTELNQEAGLVIYLDDDNYLYVSRAFTGSGNELLAVAEQEGIMTVNSINDLIGSTVHLKIDKSGEYYSLYASSDGVNWGTPIYTYTHQFNVSSGLSLKLGLFAQNGDDQATEIDAHFDNIYVAHTKNYLTAWFDHGTDPIDSSYSYVLLPTMTSEQVSSYSSSPEITVLSNTGSIHAVRENNLNIIGMTFWDSGGIVDKYTAYNKSAMMVEETSDAYSIVVSDPSQLQSTLSFEIEDYGTGVISSDPNITVTQFWPTLKFDVDTAGSKGKSFSIIIDRTGTLINPHADSYVRDGLYADTNYGADTTLVVKSGNPDYTRKSYIKFDYSETIDGTSVSGAVLRVKTKGVNTAASRTIKIYGNNDKSWTESGITFNNAPSGSTYLGEIVVDTTVGKWYEVDVTDYVNNHMSNKLVSFLLINEGSASQDNDVSFSSKEDAAGAPELVIYRRPPPQDMIIDSNADSYVRGGVYSDTNYGSETGLVVKNVNNIDFYRKSYLKFDYNSLISSSAASAILRVNARALNTDPTRTISVYGTDESWTETGITYNNAPAGNTFIGSFEVTTTGWYEIDVTNYVNNNMIDKIVSLQLINEGAAGASTDVTFSSREDISGAPELVITPTQNFIFNPNADSYVRGGIYTNNNYGTETGLVVKNDNNNDFYRKSYLKFDFNSLDSPSAVSAKLRVNARALNTDPTRTISVYGTDESWTETGITYNNAPAGNTFIGSFEVTTTGWYEIDVTNYVNNNMIDKIVSLQLINEGAAGASTDVTFSSREDTTNHPELVIAY